MAVDRVISAVRALVARELVARGFSVNETARILRVTPAAVSMYLSGKRGGEMVAELAADERVMSVIRSSVEMAVESLKAGRRDALDVGEVARVVAGLLEARRGGGDVGALLRERIRLEQETASRAMAYSYRARNPLVRALFMQIAADSLRHAEILTAVLDYLEGRIRAGGEDLGLSREELEEIAEEERSMRESLAPLYGSVDPVVRALLLSVELDEMKHYELVRALLLRG